MLDYHEIAGILERFGLSFQNLTKTYDCPIRFNGLPVSDKRSGQFG